MHSESMPHSELTDHNVLRLVEALADVRFRDEYQSWERELGALNAAMSSALLRNALHRAITAGLDLGLQLVDDALAEQDRAALAPYDVYGAN